MTPEALACLHRAAFWSERPWSAAEFDGLLDSRFVHLNTHPHGFALSRTVAGESELLTIAVHPDFQGQGIGRALTKEWLAGLRGSAQTAFLEVAADNTAALHLYTTEGFTEIGRRAGYYARKNAAAADAIVMQRGVTFGQTPESTTQTRESG